MRLTVQQKRGGAGIRDMRCTLLPGSAIWPGLLMLRVGGDDGTVRVVAVLTDSVGAEEFRALAVAIRVVGAMAAPNQALFDPHKIV